MLHRKSVKWRGSYKATFLSDDGDEEWATPDGMTWDDYSSAYFHSSRRGGYVHHLSGRAFLAAAHQGCRLCLLLVSQLSPESRLAMAEEPEDIDTSSKNQYMTVYLLERHEEIAEGARRLFWIFTGTYCPNSFSHPVILFSAVFNPSLSELCPTFLFTSCVQLTVDRSRAIIWSGCSISESCGAR